MKILQIDPKSTYRIFCEKNDQLEFYFQDWWLDTVCGADHWNVVLCRDKERKINAVLPFSYKRQYGFRLSRMPLLTPYLGLKVFYPKTLQKNSSVYSFENKIYTELLEGLPKLDFYNQYYSPYIKNIMPFHQTGFSPIGMSNYVLDLTQKTDELFDQMDSRVRNDIRRAKENFKLDKNGRIGDLVPLVEKSFLPKSMPFSKGLLQSVDQCLEERNMGKIYLVLDQKDMPAAGVLLLNDGSKIYTLLIGSDPKKRKGGAVQFLLWEIIREWQSKAETLDFCGSIIPTIEPVFRGFGARHQAYFQIQKISHPLLKLAKWMKR